MGLPCGLLLLSVVIQAQREARLEPQQQSQQQPQRRHAVTAMVDSVAKTGFYRIILPPAFVAHCRPDLSDLRIFKPDGEQVPYVLRTGIHDRLNAGWLSLPDPSIRQRDSSNKHSYYRLQYDNAYRIDRLSFVISNPVLYKRSVRIMAAENSATPEPVAYASIDPNDTAFEIPAIKAQILLVDITNGDNAPLAITRVASAQSGIYILTWFRAFSGSGYELMGGNHWSDPPDYDLHYFTDSMRRRPLDIGLKSIHVEDMAPDTQSAAIKKVPSTGKDGGIPANSGSGLLLWSVLIFVLLLLVYVTSKLARAISRKEKS